jgi:hypothetical protein
MDAWLRPETASKGASFRFRLVHNPLYATPMTESAAPEAMHGAKREYPEYAWAMEVGFNNGEFFVHTGTNKNKSPIRGRAEAASIRA